MARKVAERWRWAGWMLVLVPLFLLEGCRSHESTRMRVFPKLMLWAWEEPQDLRFLKSRGIGVAFFAEQLRLRNGTLDRRRRRTPLLLDPSTPLMAVVRIDGDPEDPPVLDEVQMRAVLAELAGVLSMPGVQGLQIDFDARQSERLFYARLMTALRAAHPATPLSMTALVSWCGPQGWINDLPVDEATPMCFRMGPGSGAIRDQLRAGVDFGPARARSSLGLSLDEPWSGPPLAWRRQRRIYVFCHGSWTKETVERLQGDLVR